METCSGTRFLLREDRPRSPAPSSSTTELLQTSASSRERIMILKRGVLLSACRTELRKQVLPRFASPPAASLPFPPASLACPWLPAWPCACFSSRLGCAGPQGKARARGLGTAEAEGWREKREGPWSSSRRACGIAALRPPLLQPRRCESAVFRPERLKFDSQRELCSGWAPFAFCSGRAFVGCVGVRSRESKNFVLGDRETSRCASGTHLGTFSKAPSRRARRLAARDAASAVATVTRVRLASSSSTRCCRSSTERTPLPTWWRTSSLPSASTSSTALPASSSRRAILPALSLVAPPERTLFA
mmetsp:Transcript_18886/g.72782  ORF Transcript_18886/g.72782 Transcript_18886/m.72782 type:complete len:304 (-) Transcript_18886:192-1103(-)